MASYVPDNEGQGFSLEDDDDPIAMMDRAAEAGERGVADAESDEDLIEKLRSGKGSSTEATAEPAAEEAEAEVKNTTVEEATSPTPETQHQPISQQESPVAGQTPQAANSEAKTAGEDAGPMKPMTPSSRARIIVPSEAEEVSLVTRALRVAEALRGLSADVRSVVAQFVTTDDDQEPSSDEAVIIVKTLRAEPVIFETMRSMKEAKAAEPVDRVFYVLSLSDEVLHSLGSLTAAFSDEVIDKHEPRLDFARKLVKQIHQLDKRSMDYVLATESVLSAGQP